MLLLRRAAYAATLLITLMACAVRDSGSSLLPEQSYMARAAFYWENLNHFQLRGRARALGGNLVAEGPFVLWGTRSPARLRGDMYGPDGRPVLSFLCDSTGFLAYLPGDRTAVFHAGGLLAGRGYLETESLVALLRTGFPAPPRHWVMAELYFGAGWLFAADGDTAVLEYSRGLFPTRLVMGDMEASIIRSSWHGEYQAWPAGWRIATDSGTSEFTISSFDLSTEPWDEVWTLRIPVPVDTLFSPSPWRLIPEPSVR